MCLLLNFPILFCGESSTMQRHLVVILLLFVIVFGMSPSVRWRRIENFEQPSSSEYPTALVRIINKFQIKTIVDISCGDCASWLPRLLTLFPSVSYTGIDKDSKIVTKLKKSMQAFRRANFVVGDFMTYTIPRCDMLLCQNTLQHMSLDDAKKTVKFLTHAGGFAKLSVIESYIEGDNTPPKNGELYKPNLDAPPFNVSSAHHKEEIDARRNFSVVVFDRSLLH